MLGVTEFTYSITARPRALIEVQVCGYLTAEDSSVYLKAVERAILKELSTRQPTVRLMWIDQLTGFQPVKVPRLHGVWFAERGETVARIAVVSSKASVSFGLAAVKLLTKLTIKAFAEPADAIKWLES